jgi:hypothetical protein
MVAVQLAEAARLVPQVLLVILKSPGSAPEVAMLLIVIAAVPPLVKVTGFGAPPAPTSTLTQFRVVGLTEALPPVVEVAPVPDNATVCGLLLAASVNDSVALRAPVAVGLNATIAAQLAEAARLAPQVLLVMEKSPASAPVMATLLMAIAAVPPLLKVAVCDALLEPTIVLAKVRPDGVAVTPPAGLTPSPVSAIVCGLLLAVSLKSRVAERSPVVVGANRMLAVQLADAARLVPQVLLNISKSPGFVPASVMLLMVSAVVLLLVSVTTFCAPLLPTETLTQFRLAGETPAWAMERTPWNTSKTTAAFTISDLSC